MWKVLSFLEACESAESHPEGWAPKASGCPLPQAPNPAALEVFAIQSLGGGRAGILFIYLHIPSCSILVDVAGCIVTTTDDIHSYKWDPARGHVELKALMKQMRWRRKRRACCRISIWSWSNCAVGMEAGICCIRNHGWWGERFSAKSWRCGFRPNCSMRWLKGF